MQSSLILDDKNIYSQAINYFNNLQTILKNNIFHCYDKNRKEIDVFLEDYTYFSLLLVSIYEINKDENSLKKCSELLKQTWNFFYDEDNNLLQKNIKNSNDLFVNPIDI